MPAHRLLRMRDAGKAPWVDQAIAELLATVREQTREAARPLAAQSEIVPFNEEKVA